MNSLVGSIRQNNWKQAEGLVNPKITIVTLDHNNNCDPGSQNQFYNAIWAKETTFMTQLLSDFIGDFKYEI